MAISYPTFVDGDLLTAAQLNQLGSAVGIVRSAVETTGVVFASVTATGEDPGMDGDPASATLSFWGRRSQRYLVHRATGNCNQLGLAITPEGGARTIVFSTRGTLDGIAEAYWVDLDAITGLDVGDFYKADLTIVQRLGATGDLTVFLLYERPAA